ncbi:MAG: D-glycero-beta-D-manno-heptose-1,7-bisphosphate 7-phosphatase [Proteobacteria bacterium]|nr:MAG: D-glycero-beta-D-manno-heptose-1,7-bisphosphate 7-phosphatase [Pseudomonadota bacterium]
MPNLEPTLPKAILLDRDGVINFDSPDYILSPEQWRAIPGSLEAIAKLTQANIPVAIVSNQSAVGRGMIDNAIFQNIHAKMLLSIEALGGQIDHVAYCIHAPDDGCTCRKPLPGMMLDSLTALNLSTEPQSVYMIGDSLRDMQAAWAANVSGILVQSGYGDAADILAKARLHDPHIQAFPDLAAAVCSILKH